MLLAGEIVTGGKQDRVIGKDRIVPAEERSMDLDVFSSSRDARWRVATSLGRGLDWRNLVFVRKRGRKGSAEGSGPGSGSARHARGSHPPSAAGDRGRKRSLTHFVCSTVDCSPKKRLDEVVVPMQRAITQLCVELRDRRGRSGCGGERQNHIGGSSPVLRCWRNIGRSLFALTRLEPSSNAPNGSMLRRRQPRLSSKICRAITKW